VRQASASDGSSAFKRLRLRATSAANDVAEVGALDLCLFRIILGAVFTEVQDEVALRRRELEDALDFRHRRVVLLGRQGGLRRLALREGQQHRCPREPA
jgi:hypothetical protein